MSERRIAPSDRLHGIPRRYGVPPGAARLISRASGCTWGPAGRIRYNSSLSFERDRRVAARMRGESARSPATQAMPKRAVRTPYQSTVVAARDDTWRDSALGEPGIYRNAERRFGIGTRAISGARAGRRGGVPLSAQAHLRRPTQLKLDFSSRRPAHRAWQVRRHGLVRSTGVSWTQRAVRAPGASPFDAVELEAVAVALEQGRQQSARVGTSARCP